MFIYRLEAKIDNTDEGTVWDFDYLTHENKYTDIEFKNMCEEAYQSIADKCSIEMKQYLIKNKGFKKLEITSAYDFIEE